MKRKLYSLVAKLLRSVLMLNKPNRFGCAFYEDIELVYDQHRNDQVYKIACPNSVNLWRAKTYFTKEPDMIEWMDTFDQNTSFMDIGANIGLYTIYAAKRNVKKVVAFEPESQNYALLNKNLYLNNYQTDVYALNLGLSDKSGMENLFIPKFQAGLALNNLGEATDWKKESFIEDFKQAVVSFKLDDFIKQFPELAPTHVKIDVDGLEYKIILGAMEMLKNDSVRELMIELNENLEEDMKIFGILESCGFKVKSKYHSPLISSTYDSVSNHLFSKD